MSERTDSIGPELRDYIAAHTRGDDAFLVELKAAARAAGLPSIWIAPEQASFIQVLLKNAGARAVVDIGTLAGYSAIQMARALPAGGRVRTLERAPEHAAFARAWIARSDVAERIELFEGDARETLAGFADASADALMMDADKASYPVYLEHARRIVRPGGLILADNAFAFGQLFDEHPTDREVGAVRAFNELVARTAWLHAALVPLGDGLWVGVREAD